MKPLDIVHGVFAAGFLLALPYVAHALFGLGQCATCSRHIAGWRRHCAEHRGRVFSNEGERDR